MIQYLLNNAPCNPKNREDIRFRISYEERNRVSEYEISVENMVFVNEDKQAIHQWLATYGNGVGMPFSVVFSSGQILSYYIDFTDESTIWNDVEFSAKIVRYRANVNFFDKANGLSWRLVNFQPNDFTEVQYVVIPEQQPLYFITLGLAAYATAQQLAQTIEDIQQGIADLAAILPPLPANAGAIVAASIRIAARIARAVALTIALINLMQQIIEMILPAVRTMKDIPYIRLIRKGCEHLGYTLDSSDIDSLSQLSFLGTPERSLDGGIIREIIAPMSLQFTWGFPTEMDSIRTLGEAIERFEELFNLRTKVNNGVVRIERRINNAVNQTPIPLAYNDQQLALMNKRLNNQFWKRKILLWTKDSRDTWTYDDKEGHLAEFDVSPIITPDPNLNLFKGLQRVNCPFSLGSRKNSFTRVERFLKNVLAPAVDLFTGGSFSAQINNRIGVLVLSSQYYTVNKLLWKSGNKIAVNHRDVLNAKRIINQWHQEDSVINRNKLVIENLPIRMTETQFLLLSSQNVVTLSNGEQAEMVSVEWSEHEHEASATILVPNPDNINIQETCIYGSGY
jgi:hypothetical protein